MKKLLKMNHRNNSNKLKTIRKIMVQYIKDAQKLRHAKTLVCI